MNDELYGRIMRQARRTAEIYKPFADKERFAELVEVLEKFQKYIDSKSGDPDMLYDLVHGEHGIWLHIGGGSHELEQQMLSIEICILSCMIWKEFERFEQIVPEDLEFRGENIPEYINFLEENFNSPNNSELDEKFWREKMCY